MVRPCSALETFLACDPVGLLLLKADATERHHLVLTGASHSISPPHLLSAYLIDYLFYGRCPAQLLPLQRQQGLIAGKQERAGCITKTYYDDEMSYKAPNTLLEKSPPPIRRI